MEKPRNGCVRLRAGLGREYEVSREVAERYADRSVGDALRAMIQDHIHDPQLRELLCEPDIAIDLCAEGDDGSHQESPLSKHDSWRKVVDRLEQNTCEVGIARMHRGG